MKNLSIAIDGPAGSGKSTVADEVAERLGMYHLDTGAMYRAFGYSAITRNISPSDIKGVEKLLTAIKMEVVFDKNKEQHVLVDGVDLTEKIRTNEVSRAASDFSKIAQVRQKLVALQREIANEQPIILDGRDICAYVLPNADIKLYLTADVEERAKRRLIQLHNSGQELDKTLEEMAAEIAARDKQDMERAVSPLTIAEDATVIDTTNMNKEQVCDLIIKMVGEL